MKTPQTNRNRSPESRRVSRWFCLLILSALPGSRTAALADPLVAPRPTLQTPAPKSFLGIIAHPSLRSAADPDKPPEKAHGLTILRVIPDSPAAQAGLKPHDVLLSYQDTPLTSTAHLGRLLAQDDPGTPVELTIQREAGQRTISVKLGVCPARIPEKNATRSVTLPEPIAGLGTGKMMIVPEKAGTSGPSHPNLIIPGQIPALSQSIVISRSAEGQYRVEIIEIPSKGEPKIQKLEGSRETVCESCDELPAHLQTEVPRLVRSMPQAEETKSSFQFRLQPRLNGEDQALRILMTQVNKQNEARVFQLTQTFPDQANVKVEDLLTVEPFAKELKQLPMPISQSIETTLRRYRLPRIELDVQNPQ